MLRCRTQLLLDSHCETKLLYHTVVFVSMSKMEMIIWGLRIEGLFTVLWFQGGYYDVYVLGSWDLGFLDMEDK